MAVLRDQSGMRNTMAAKHHITTILSGGFGIIAAIIGIINIGWGNDPFFGVFILLLSALFFSPVTGKIRQLTGIAFPIWAKILLAVFILWASLGVGELFDKVDMLLHDLSS